MNEKLVLVSGSGKSRELAKDMYDILKNDYCIGDNVDLLLSKRGSELTQEEKEAKDGSRPLVIDRFGDGETRVEAGGQTLYSLNNTHVVFVNYFYEPTEGISINDKIFEARSFGELLKNVKVRKCTLASPYTPYIQAHSVKKYVKGGAESSLEKMKASFFQADTLNRFLVDVYGMKETWDNTQPKSEIIVIDPHDDATIEKHCERLGIEYRYVNPFQKDIDYTKLGIKDKNSERAKKILGGLQPFFQHFIKHPERYDNSLLVALDEGTDARTKKFNLAVGRDYDSVCALDKVRVDTGERKLSLKEFSAVKEDGIKGKRCILVDDMGISFGSADTASKFLLEKGASAVELWVTHNKCQCDDEGMKKLSLDWVVCIDTILHKDVPKCEVIPASANLLSMITYKSYMAELAKQRYF